MSSQTSRLAPSGSPQFAPTQVPELVGMVHADTLKRQGADMVQWANLTGGLPFELSPDATSAPQVVTVNGKQVVQFAGDGATPDVGSYMQCADPAMSAAWRYLSSQAQFYFAATLQAPVIPGQQIAIAASAPAADNAWQGIIVNQEAANRRGSWSGQNGGIPAELRDTDELPSADPALWEVKARILSPGTDNAGTYQTLTVNGVQRAETSPAATIGDYPQPLTVMTLGGVQRASGYPNSFGGWIRAAVWCVPAPSEATIIAIRKWLLADLL
jgi:hypothetical protein